MTPSCVRGARDLGLRRCSWPCCRCSPTPRPGRTARLLGPGRRRAPSTSRCAPRSGSAYRRGELPAWNPRSSSARRCSPPTARARSIPLMAARWRCCRPSPPSRSWSCSRSPRPASLVFLYVRRLGAEPRGRLRGAGCRFALGPYLVGHLGDTRHAGGGAAAAARAAGRGGPHAPRRRRRARPASPSRSALLLLAGSPEAARAGLALVAGRLAGRRTSRRARAGARAPRRALLAARGAGVLLAAPQLVPTLLAAREAGRAGHGPGRDRGRALPGRRPASSCATSRTRPRPRWPWPRCPLALTPDARCACWAWPSLLCLALQWGRGPARRARARSPLVFDLTLCVLAGLSLSAQWRARREPRGPAPARATSWSPCLASAAALSVAAAALGPAARRRWRARWACSRWRLILYFSLAAVAATPCKAGVWLLPLTVVLPAAAARPRASGTTRPRAAELRAGHARTRRGARPRDGRRAAASAALTLVREWPRAQAAGPRLREPGRPRRRAAAPTATTRMVPLRTRDALGGMGAGGHRCPARSSATTAGAAGAARRALGAGARVAR